jgi:hypothetical protein
MSAERRCQCRRFSSGQCSSDMTQEDLLCDQCRAGCTGLVVPLGGEAKHYRFTEVRFSFDAAGLDDG